MESQSKVQTRPLGVTTLNKNNHVYHGYFSLAPLREGRSDRFSIKKEQLRQGRQKLSSYCIGAGGQVCGVVCPARNVAMDALASASAVTALA
jgi:hypothetical protein